METQNPTEYTTNPTALNTYKVAIYVSETKKLPDDRTFLCFVGPYDTYPEACDAANRYLHIVRHFGMKFGLRTAPETNIAHIFMDDGSGIYRQVSCNYVASRDNCEDLKAYEADIELMLHALRQHIGMRTQD